MATKKPEASNALADIEAHAGSIRSELNVPKQNEVFRAAVEAGYLTAFADGEVDDAEREAMVKAIELLSEGAVIEWETENLLDECAARTEKEGAAARTTAVGKTLAELGHAEVGIFFAAVIARASKGIDKKEADALKAVGAAAGVAADKVAEIVKRAGKLS